MASGLNLRIGKTLVWETTFRSGYWREVTPLFSFMNSKWILESLSSSSNNTFPSCFSVYIKHIGEIKSFQPFEVTTYLEDKRNRGQMHCSKLTVLHSEELLFRASIDEIREKLPGLVHYDDINVVFMLIPCSLLVLTEETGNNEMNSDDTP